MGKGHKQGTISQLKTDNANFITTDIHNKTN